MFKPHQKTGKNRGFGQKIESPSIFCCIRRMKQLLILPVLLLTLLVWNPAFSADLQKGYHAYIEW